MNADWLQSALDLVGALLEDRGHRFEIVAVGGGALHLIGEISRPTKDVDVLALVDAGEYRTAHPLPAALREAVADVAAVQGLDAEWMNPGPTAQLRQGLPAGFRERARKCTFGALTLHVAGRFDQICFKLYAAADGGRHSKHLADLIEMRASSAELRAAAPWVKEQDASPDFKRFVDEVIDHVEANRGPR